VDQVLGRCAAQRCCQLDIELVTPTPAISGSAS
jgi:hypothetical protein